MDGVVKVLPVKRGVPPMFNEYQLTVPAQFVALSVTGPVPHLEPGLYTGVHGCAIQKYCKLNNKMQNKYENNALRLT
jgi:hypothetical protein